MTLGALTPNFGIIKEGKDILIVSALKWLILKRIYL